jgi:hypothetical protein
MEYRREIPTSYPGFRLTRRKQGRTLRDRLGLPGFGVRVGTHYIGRKAMGDKSKKDKEKGAKQSAAKQQQEAKRKSEKQPKRGS